MHADCPSSCNQQMALRWHPTLGGEDHSQFGNRAAPRKPTRDACAIYTRFFHRLALLHAEFVR